MTKENGFVKEYYTGRKDQFDVDYALFREAAKAAKTKEELVGMLNEKYQFVISRIAEKRANTLKEDLGLI
ncbi:MAG: hypothetical protein KIS29_01525 [Thermoplasmata archaeon]|nr:hypothetical protein [Candidatus Sysuiplasma jiujiangense]